MNLFVTSINAFECARNVDDKRVGKLGLEGVQVLCAVLAARGIPAPYRATHVHHPVVKWAKLNDTNAYWLVQYCDGMFDEFEYRFGKAHKTSYVLNAIRHHFPVMSDVPVEFANCARNSKYGLDFTNLPIEEAYKRYLTERWKTDTRRVTFTNRNFPNFFENSCVHCCLADI